MRRRSSGYLTKEQAAFDINSLLHALLDIHPDIFSVAGHEKIMSAFTNTLNQLPDSLTSLELYRRIAPVVTLIGDAHTMTRFPYPDLFTDSLKRFPSYVNVFADGTVTVDACLDSVIPAKSVITSINGIPTDSIIRSMVPFMSGERDFYRITRLDKQFAALFELLYGGNPEYTIEYLRPGKEKTEKVTLPAVTHKEFLSRKPASEPKFDVEPYTFSIDKKNKIAVMEFNKCYYNKIRQFCDSMFAILHQENIQKLIIDVRKNSGGDSRVGDEILKRIAKKPFS